MKQKVKIPFFALIGLVLSAVKSVGAEVRIARNPLSPGGRKITVEETGAIASSLLEAIKDGLPLILDKAVIVD